MKKFEHKSQPLLPFRKWLKRVLHSISIATAIIAVALFIGVVGYHVMGHLDWIDSLLEASMILGGMGPVAPMSNDAVKLFASLYALFSGLIVLSTAGIIVAPWLHRLMHHLHQTETGQKKSVKARPLKKL